jgi:hypothetical protein
VGRQEPHCVPQRCADCSAARRVSDEPGQDAKVSCIADSLTSKPGFDLLVARQQHGVEVLVAAVA